LATWHGVVAHPLQVGHHPQRGDQHAQVAGDRLLARQQVEAPGLGVAVEAVHLLVVGDHRLGQLQVGVQQAVVARLMAEPTRLVISTREAEMASSSSW
jgi:hypothetical protein